MANWRSGHDQESTLDGRYRHLPGEPRVSPARVAAASSTGLVRKRNEDSAYVGRWLCAVADGMGGHAAGDIASATVIDAIRAFDVKETSPAHLTSILSAAVSTANLCLTASVQAKPELGNMGSTLTALLWSSGHVAVAHIGDSRAYLLRSQVLQPITEDHVLSNLVASPQPPQIGDYLVRFLDSRPGWSPDLTLRAAHPGDRYLICSDGLGGFVAADAIRDALIDVGDPDNAVTDLIRLAHDAGAPDNVTVIAIDVPDGAWTEQGERPLILGAAASHVDSSRRCRITRWRGSLPRARAKQLFHRGGARGRSQRGRWGSHTQLLRPAHRPGRNGPRARSQGPGWSSGSLRPRHPAPQGRPPDPPRQPRRTMPRI
jgi:serine/threonine protein phosphatase PrpC